MSDAWTDALAVARIWVNTIYILALMFAMSHFKCGARTVRIAYALVLGVAAAFNALLYFLVGREKMMGVFAFSVAVPSLAVLLFLTRDRLPALLFNFFTAVNALYLVSVVGLSVSQNEKIWLDILVRAALYTVILYLFARYFRGPYHFLADNMTRGWWVVSVIPFLFFCMVMYLGLFPRLNHDNFPAVVMLYGVLCCVYVVIYQVFFSTYMRLRQAESARMLEAQLTAQRQGEEQLRLLRHDMRHYINSVAVLLGEGNTEEAQKLIARFDALAQRSTGRRWCEDDALNAVLTFYLAQAEAEGIQVEARLDLPNPLPVKAEGLFAIFANAVENAIHACRLQGEGEPRKITLTAVSSPQPAIEISNTYGGEVRFGRNGLPLPAEKGHGVGTRSILASARRSGADCTFSVRDGRFRVQILWGAGAGGA